MNICFSLKTFYEEAREILFTSKKELRDHFICIKTIFSRLRGSVSLGLSILSAFQIFRSVLRGIRGASEFSATHSCSNTYANLTVCCFELGVPCFRKQESDDRMTPGIRILLLLSASGLLGWWMRR